MIRMWTQEDLNVKGPNSTMQEEGSKLQELAKLLEIGETMRKLRNNKGLSLRGVQDVTGGEVTANWLSQLEQGRVDNPGIKQVVALAKLYGKDLNEMGALFKVWNNQ